MNTHKSTKNKTKRFGQKLMLNALLATTAITAAGIMGVTNVNAQDVGLNKDWDATQIVKGDANVIDTGIGLTTINQNGAQAVGQLNDASIGENAIVTIGQNDTGDLFVMRDVAGNNPTQILGTLQTRQRGAGGVLTDATGGSVMVLDKNGVIFGENSQVDMQSIAVSTGRVTNENIVEGGDTIITDINNGGDIVIEQGAQINVGQAGLAAFVAPNVTNKGVINAKMGTVAIGAGQSATLDLYGDGLVEIAVEGDLNNALLQNQGSINAEGGRVQITAKAAKSAVDNIVNVDGVVNVSSATVQDGKIILNGGNQGTVQVSGDLNANGELGGGEIEISGENVRINGDANIITNNGDVTINTSDEVTITSGEINAQGGDIEINNEGSFRSIENTLKTSGTGTVSVNQTKDENVVVVADEVADETQEEQVATSQNAPTPETKPASPATTTNDEPETQSTTAPTPETKPAQPASLAITANDEPTIQNAIDAIDNTGTGANTVTVDSGTYNESVDANVDNLKLIGANAGKSGTRNNRVEESTIQALSQDGVHITADNVEVNGFEIVNSDNGVRAQNADNAVVRNNIITDPTNTGVLLTQDSDKVRVTQNLITDAVDGIKVTADSNRANIATNNIRNSEAFGIFTQDGTRRVVSNIITKTGKDAIHIRNSDNVFVVDNTVLDSGSDGIDVVNSNNTKILANKINGTKRYGLNVRGGTLHNIRSNRLNTTGIDAINVSDFGSAWISNNDISFAAGDGIDALNGQFVSINNNSIEHAGFKQRAGDNPNPRNRTAFSTADGIQISNISGENQQERGDGSFGTSLYGTAAEIYSNNIGHTAKDGINAINSNSIFIDDNAFLFNRDDGIDVANIGVTHVTNNTMASVLNKGISIQNAQYAGIFDNVITAMGGDSITVQNVTGGINNDNVGWSTDISDNTLDVVGGNGIQVQDAGPTRIFTNKINNVGMGPELAARIKTSNAINADTKLPAATTGQFTHQWGNGHGISVSNATGAIDSPNGLAVHIHTNRMNGIGGHGIIADDSGRTRIHSNRVENAGMDTSTFVNSGTPVTLKEYVGSTDVFFNNSTNFKATDRTYDTFDGIHALNIFEENVVQNRPYALRISDNIVINTGDDGINANYSGRTFMRSNVIRRAGKGDAGDMDGADGINITGISTSPRDVEQGVDANYAVTLRNNNIRLSADDNIEIVALQNGSDRVTDIRIDNNDVGLSGDNGIAILSENISAASPALTNADIKNNVIKTASTNGLLVGGENNGNVILNNNALTDNPVAARFESGEIGLTGETNTVTITSNYELPTQYQYVTGLQFDLNEAVQPSRLTIKDETLGTTEFNGFNTGEFGEAFYVRFEDGAILQNANGQSQAARVIEIDGTDARFDGLTPSDQDDNLTTEQFIEIEERLYDADDLPVNGRGQIFGGSFPLLDQEPVEIDADIEQENVFNQFSPFAAGARGLNITLQGLPTIPGAPAVANLNDIAPAAGEGDGLNQIESAAGDESAMTSCWGDTINSASSGNTVNLSFGGSPDDLLNGESRCNAKQASL